MAIIRIHLRVTVNGLPITASRSQPCRFYMPTMGAMCGCLARCLCEEGCEDRGCLYRSNPWTCTSKKVGFSLAWVRRMDPYEHLSIYSSSFQPTITFSGDFSKSGIVPGVVNIQKLPISALFYLVFGIKKPGSHPWSIHN